MYLNVLVLLISAFILAAGQVTNECNDCQDVTECSSALDLVRKFDQASKDRLRGSFCGFRNNKPQVCCSTLIDGLDSHPNVGLLPQDCGFINGDRLIGGRTADLYQFPWMVLISYNTRSGLKFQCSGTLINKRYILTAAHCVVNQTVAGVRVGEYDYRTATDCVGEPPKVICESNIQDIRVEEFVIHPKYKGRPGVVENDIALIRVRKEVDFTPKNAKPICLPITSELRLQNITGSSAVLAGWGITEDHDESPILLTVKVPVHTVEHCRSIYNRGKNPPARDATLNKFCAGEYGKDSCNGDSGGPLLISGDHNNQRRYIQYGIVSYGPRLCGSDFPGVYTDVSKFMPWILDSLKP